MYHQLNRLVTPPAFDARTSDDLQGAFFTSGGSMKKSKGVTLKQWLTEVWNLADEKRLLKYIDNDFVSPLYHMDTKAKDVFDEIFLLIEDVINNKVLAIYPMSKRVKFIYLLQYAGYSERLATQHDMDNKKHCISAKTDRAKKDKTTPLFGDMPVCKKRLGF